MKDKQIEFLYNSISDSQEIIRAIDTKVSFLLVIIIIPLSSLGKIYQKCNMLYGSHALWCILIILFILFWLISGAALLKTLVGISNPRDHVLGLPKKPNKYYRPNGSFYGGYLFSFNPKKKFTDFLYNISHNFYNHEIKSNLSIYTEIKKLPTNEDEIIKELVLEKIKITYIREIKILRSKACIYSMIIWMFFGCAIWLASLMQPHKSSPPKENEKICINFTIKNIEEPITKPTTPLKYFSHDNKKNVDCDKLIPYSSMKSSESFNLNNLVGLP